MRVALEENICSVDYEYLPNDKKLNLTRHKLKKDFTINRIVYLVFAAALAVIFLFFFIFTHGFKEVLPMLSQIHLQIGNFILNNYIIALFCYFLIYLLLMACALPFAGLMDLLGGFYFGWVSFPIALVSVTIGSIIPFSIAKYYGGQSLERYEINILKKIESHCNNNEIKYVVIMRIIPWAPFSVATMLTGALKIKSSNFMTGTALGFLPWGFGLNELGQGFASILQMEEITILEVIKTPIFFFGLIITIGAIAGGKFIKSYYQKILK